VAEDVRAHLARGSLLARAGRRAESAADLLRAGDSFAARWCRAALLVTGAVAGRTGSPDAGALALARAQAGEPSAFWSDPTVGRLLFSLLAARPLAGDGDGSRRASDADADTRSLLRAAESQIEHDTFWDRALVLVGWVRVGSVDEVERVASALARAEASVLEAQPAVAGPGLHDVARGLGEASRAIDAGEPARARQAIAGLLAREDLRRFRLPCLRCRRGSIGIDEVRETVTDAG
jgi:hypothetical protein